jgi:hypothetical protein
VHFLQLQHVAPGKGAQERSQRGWCPDSSEQRGQRAVPQQAHVIDAVRPGDHPGHQARHFHRRVHPARPGDPDMLTGQIAQARSLRERHHRNQTRLRHQTRVIERRVDFRELVQQSHLRGVLSSSAIEA